MILAALSTVPLACSSSSTRFFISSSGAGIPRRYAIDQAVKDGAVVPLLYEGRHVEQDVNSNGIDVWFERVGKDLTPDQKADLKRKFARYSEIGQTEPTIYCIAYDISEHYAKYWKGTGFKAQLATRSKRAALLYKRALDEIGMASSEVVISAPDDREGYDEVGDESREELDAT